MHTKLLMTLSALFMAAMGIVNTFLPQELAARFGASPESYLAPIFQILGGLYLGFAIVNWMAKSLLIGGIYSRPLAMGNFMHFVVVALALIKNLMAGFHAREIIFLASLYSLFAIWFGLVLFTHPIRSQSGTSTAAG